MLFHSCHSFSRFSLLSSRTFSFSLFSWSWSWSFHLPRKRAGKEQPHPLTWLHLSFSLFLLFLSHCFQLSFKDRQLSKRKRPKCTLNGKEKTQLYQIYGVLRWTTCCTFLSVYLSCTRWLIGYLAQNIFYFKMHKAIFKVFFYFILFFLSCDMPRVPLSSTNSSSLSLSLSLVNILLLYFFVLVVLFFFERCCL